MTSQVMKVRVTCQQKSSQKSTQQDSFKIKHLARYLGCLSDIAYQCTTCNRKQQFTWKMCNHNFKQLLCTSVYYCHNKPSKQADLKTRHNSS